MVLPCLLLPLAMLGMLAFPPCAGSVACDHEAAAEPGASMLQMGLNKPQIERASRNESHEAFVAMSQDAKRALEEAIRGLNPKLQALVQETQTLVSHRKTGVDASIMKNLEHVVHEMMMNEILSSVVRDQKLLDDAARALNNHAQPTDMMSRLVDQVDQEGQACAECARALQTGRAARDEACNSSDAWNLLQVPDECTTKYLKSKQMDAAGGDLDHCEQFFHKAFIEHQERKRSCDEAWAAAAEREKSCSPLLRRFHNTACAAWYEAHSTCHEYEEKYTSHLRDFMQVNNTVTDGLMPREEEFKGVKLILCLMIVIGIDVPTTQVDERTRKCLGSKVDYSPLRLHWPQLQPMAECSASGLYQLLSSQGKFGEMISPTGKFRHIWPHGFDETSCVQHELPPPQLELMTSQRGSATEGEVETDKMADEGFQEKTADNHDHAWKRNEVVADEDIYEEDMRVLQKLASAG